MEMVSVKQHSQGPLGTPQASSAPCRLVKYTCIISQMLMFLKWEGLLFAGTLNKIFMFKSVIKSLVKFITNALFDPRKYDSGTYVIP